MPQRNVLFEIQLHVGLMHELPNEYKAQKFSLKKKTVLHANSDNYQVRRSRHLVEEPLIFFFFFFFFFIIIIFSGRFEF
jgi:hypothetical protein